MRTEIAGMSATVIIVVAAGVYMAIGVVLGSAAYIPGSTIRYGEPILWARLPEEAGRVSLAAVLSHIPWLLGPLYLLAATCAVGLRAVPKLAERPMALSLLKVFLILGALPAVWGCLSFLSTILNATILGGLDGEWLDEFHPIAEAFFLSFLTLSWTLRSLRVPLRPHWLVSRPTSA